MASQKEKYLNSAQKFIQKGQLERAIRDYEQVVAADPKDVRHRQKLAELLARCNRNEEAVREYGTIAKYYEDNGFYLKAIAVFKQIQKLDNKNVEISLTLAALNEKQGLIGNALSDYKNVFDYYEKEGLSKEACKILEKMHAVDPENVDIRLKLAETYFAAGFHDDAYQEYTRAALTLKSRGNDALHDRVCTRIQTLFPERKEFTLDLLGEQIRNGIVADAIPGLKQMLEKDERNLKLLSLLAEACKVKGDMEERKSALNRMLRFYPSEAAAKEGLIECFVEEGNLEESLKMLDLYAPDMISAGRFVPLEKFYTALQSQAPYDTRILEGLKTLYEADGDQVKLADVRVSLNILSGNVADEQAGFAENEQGSVEAGCTVEGLPGVTEIDFPWEEEIDLTVPDDESENASVAGKYAEELILDDGTYGGEQGSGHGKNDFETYTLSLEDLAATAEEQLPGSLLADPEETLLEIEFEEPIELEVGEDQQLETGDTETHFNLGIAYKEMGLYDEAMKEFKAAAVNPVRAFDCLILQGICLREKGDLQKAEEVLKSGIDLFNQEPEKAMNLKYELALLCEASGRAEDALRIFRDVFASNPGFRETAGKIAKLHGTGDLLDLSDIDEVDIELEGIK